MTNQDSTTPEEIEVPNTSGFHWKLSVIFFLIFAVGDSCFTLHGMDGNLELEGNPIMKWFMIQFGLVGGLIVGKGLVLLLAAILAAFAVRGIDNKSNWILWLALTPMTRAYMRKKKRFWVAFLPIYLVAASQVFAVSCWTYVFIAIQS